MKLINLAKIRVKYAKCILGLREWEPLLIFENICKYLQDHFVSANHLKCMNQQEGELIILANCRQVKGSKRPLKVNANNNYYFLKLWTLLKIMDTTVSIRKIVKKFQAT